MSCLGNTWARTIVLYLVAVFFVLVGILHFINPAFFVAIVPPYLPAPLALVYISGVFEILGGVGILHSRSRRLAGIGLLLLLVAVFPSNIHMAMNPDEFPEFSRSSLYLRLPVQIVIGWLVWFAACSGETHRRGSIGSGE